MKDNPRKIVLAYSGGLDTSVILKWLIEEYGCEVVAYAADVGQGDELARVDPRARKTGASEVYIEDLREEFVRDFVFPMLRAGAVYEGTYLLGTSIARPAIAKRQVEIAQKTGSDAVAQCHRLRQHGVGPELRRHVHGSGLRVGRRGVDHQHGHPLDDGVHHLQLPLQRGRAAHR